MNDGLNPKDRIDILLEFWKEYSARSRHYETAAYTIVGASLTILAAAGAVVVSNQGLREAFLGRGDALARLVMILALLVLLQLSVQSVVYLRNARYYTRAARQIANILKLSPISAFGISVETSRMLRTLEKLPNLQTTALAVSLVQDSKKPSGD